MAKVTGPLMSMSASGTVGGTVTFDKRGFVRQRVIPANPKSDIQGNVRQKLLGVQRALRVLGASVIAAVRSLAPVAYRWNSYLLQQALGPGSSEFDASVTAYAALTSTQKDSWEADAIAAGLTDQTIDYASDDPITAGLALFAICRTLYRLGLNTSAGTPSGTNHTAWKTYFIS